MSLQEKIRASVEAFNAMSPVEKAIMKIQQRNSFARGNIDIDKEWTAAHQKAMDDDACTILMNEVLRLRALSKKDTE